MTLEEKHAGDSCEDVDVEQQFEECIRDLCTVRKTMPQKCAKLLEDYFEVIMPNYVSENLKYQAASCSVYLLLLILAIIKIATG